LADDRTKFGVRWENAEMPGLLRDLRGGLDPRGAGADEADDPAIEIHPAMRPGAGMVMLTGERFDTGDFRRMHRGQHAGR
jgi:hypothetical protein